MRIIDADALTAGIENEMCRPCEARGADHHGIKCRACGIGDALEFVEDAPTLPNPCGNPCNFISLKDDLIKAFELLKEHCKNRECNKDCVFYRELRIGDTIDHQYCGLCEIVLNDDEEAENE